MFSIPKDDDGNSAAKPPSAAYVSCPLPGKPIIDYWDMIKLLGSIGGISLDATPKDAEINKYMIETTNGIKITVTPQEAGSPWGFSGRRFDGVWQIELQGPIEYKDSVEDIRIVLQKEMGSCIHDMDNTELKREYQRALINSYTHA
ncbi:MAG: hypothetical protein KAT91_03750 [Candidatus Aenigmarchaeota archaeon]|nr:hypothetical protein [Candidatus Aenigmarchaeota archaeon]